MSAEIILYTHPMSRGRIARWMLEEVGAEYRVETLQYGAGMKSPEYLAINPMGKVPALCHGAAVVTETGAICAYLADAFPEAGLAPPAGTPDRAPYYRWMFFAAGPLEAATSNHALGFVVPEGRERAIGYGSLAAVTDLLEATLSRQDYLLGERFSAADVYLGAQIGFGLRFGMVEKRAAFERYNERIQDRPAARRASQLDDALIAAAS